LSQRIYRNSIYGDTSWHHTTVRQIFSYVRPDRK